MTTGHRLFRKDFLCLNTMPCRQMPLLVHFRATRRGAKDAPQGRGRPRGGAHDNVGQGGRGLSRSWRLRHVHRASRQTAHGHKQLCLLLRRGAPKTFERGTASIDFVCSYAGARLNFRARRCAEGCSFEESARASGPQRNIPRQPATATPHHPFLVLCTPNLPANTNYPY